MVSDQKNATRSRRGRAALGFGGREPSRSACEIGAGVVASCVLGLLVGIGQPLLAIGILAAAVALFLLTRPRWALWGFLAFLPFFIYPVTIGQLSLFLGLPAALAVSAVLVAGVNSRPRGAIMLPTASFSALAIAALASALLSSDPAHALSRVLYLISFGAFAGSVAYARSAGVIRDRDVLAPLLIGATLAGVALVAQFVAQFAIGTTGIQNQLYSLYPAFGGSSSAAGAGENWVVASFNLVRAVFPFMTAPGAGQYMMVALVTSVLALQSGIGDLSRRWLRWSILIIGCGLAATLSRQSWVGALIAMAVVSIRVRPLRLVTGIIVIAGIAFLVPLPGTHETLGQYLLLSTDTKSQSSEDRITIWSEAITNVQHGSPFGLGSGLYQTLDPTQAVYYAHNTFLDALVELGYVGGIAFIAFFGRLLVTTWRSSKALVFPVIVAVVVANMFDDVIYLPRNGFLLAALIGMAGVVAEVREPARPPVAPFEEASRPALAAPASV